MHIIHIVCILWFYPWSFLSYLPRSSTNPIFKKFSKLKRNTCRYATDRQFIIFTKIKKLNCSLEVSLLEICNQILRCDPVHGLNFQGYYNSTPSPLYHFITLMNYVSVSGRPILTILWYYILRYELYGAFIFVWYQYRVSVITLYT